MRRKPLLLLLAAATPLLSGAARASQPTPASAPIAAASPAPAAASGPTMADVLAASTAADWRRLDPENTLYVELPAGRVVIELAPAFAPNHVANVKTLAREHYFDGLAILRSQENYVVQWGDPNAESPSDATPKKPFGTAKPSLQPEFDRAITRDLPFARLADGDVYAPEVGHTLGFPVARDPKKGRTWLAHCYSMVGAGRGDTADSGSGAELYVVIGHAPRHLDRNVTLLGRVVQGMELLSTLPRGSGPLGFYTEVAQRVPLRSVRVAADVPPAERTELEVLRTDTPTFQKLVDAKRFRRESWFLNKPGHVDLCNAPLPVRPVTSATTPAGEAAPAAAGAGTVEFANSGAAAAQPAFLHGLALLHDFEYADAADAFREAQRLDPGFAMAYWGEAMTYTHPVWFQQDADKARAALARLGQTPAERLAKAPTERERDYLRALDVLYGDGSKEERDRRYADAMLALHARYPDDVDATAFAAVALLGTTHQGRDVATYMRAAALLEEVFPTHQGHPGVLHYLIHSYDDPAHAPLGLRAARLYGAVAPEAPHALHMTSHIFIALGMWDDVVAANRQAIAVVDRHNAAKGKPALVCGHYPLWLHYGLLQKGRAADARQALDACRSAALATPFVAAGPADSAVARLDSFAAMRAHLVATGGTLAAADAVSAPAGDDYADARLLLAYGDALAAARSGDAAALRDAVTRVHASAGQVAAAHKDEANPSARVGAQVMAQQADALALLAGGKRDEAIALLQTAARAEDALPFDFGPPAIPKPSDELLADTLLAAGKPALAAAAYRKTLERAPGRTVAVDGLQRAAAAH